MYYFYIKRERGELFLVLLFGCARASARARQSSARVRTAVRKQPQTAAVAAGRDEFGALSSAPHTAPAMTSSKIFFFFRVPPAATVSFSIEFKFRIISRQTFFQRISTLSIFTEPRFRLRRRVGYYFISFRFGSVCVCIGGRQSLPKTGGGERKQHPSRPAASLAPVVV